LRTPLALVVFAALTLAATTQPRSPAADAKASGFTPLFNGRDLTGWTTFLDPRFPDADPKKVWTIENGEIHCLGKPNGYLLTEKEYSDYVLRVQWRWPEKPGNSGVFVHVSGPDKIWPRGVEAQLMSGQAGDFWLVGEFKLDIDKDRQDPNPDRKRHYLRIGGHKRKLEKAPGEWNKYEI